MFRKDCILIKITSENIKLNKIIFNLTSKLNDFKKKIFFKTKNYQKTIKKINSIDNNNQITILNNDLVVFVIILIN